MADYSVRELSGLQELALTPPLARCIWGADDHPEDTALLSVIQHIGGLVAGAFDAQGTLRAYLVGLPTADARVQHSHRLGVHPDNRQQGLGERLKRFQRTWCLGRGVTQVRWTFDPLLLANAHLNVHRLGATVRHQWPNYYGEMTGINAGVPSDRFEAEWRLDSEHVDARLNGQARETWPEATVDPLQGADAPVGQNAVAVGVPPDYYRLIRDEPAQARRWRQHTRPLFGQLFEQGYALVDVDVQGQRYLFRPEAAC